MSRSLVRRGTACVQGTKASNEKWSTTNLSLRIFVMPLYCQISTHLFVFLAFLLTIPVAFPSPPSGVTVISRLCGSDIALPFHVLPFRILQTRENLQLWKNNLQRCPLLLVESGVTMQTAQRSSTRGAIPHGLSEGCPEVLSSHELQFFFQCNIRCFQSL